MRVVRKTAGVAAAAVMSVALVACGGSGGDAGGPKDSPQSLAGQAQYNPQPYENLKDGGTLTTALPEISPQFNTFQGDQTLYSRQVWNWYNPLLITFTPTGEPVFNKDYLADVKPETVDGNTKVTYTLNPKARFNDGSPFDWRVFEATWKATNATDPAYIVNSSDGYDRITSVTPGADDRQAVVTFRGINVWWPGLFNNVLNPKALAPDVFNKSYVNTPHPEWGAGPYAISKFDQQNGTITFERNPSWWGDKGKLDSRTYVTMEASASINAFKNGQIDATGVSTSDRLAQVKDMAGIDIRKSTTTSIDLFTLNSKSPMLADPAVRKAVFQGIDRAQLGKILHQGLDYSEEPPGSLNLLPFQEGYQDNFSKVITFNADEAKKGLDAAGWTAGPDGVRTRNGQPLQFTYVNTGDDPVGKAAATATAAMMKNIGITLDIRQVPSAEFSAILKGRTFDMFFSGFNQSDPYGLAYICQVYCSDSQLNVSGTGQPALDEQVKAVNQLPTEEQQFAKASEVETEAFKTYGLMPVDNGPTIVAVKKGLANVGAGMYFSSLPQNIGWQK